MSISDERLAALLADANALSPNERRVTVSGSDIFDLRSALSELQSLRAAAKVRAIREGDGEAEPVDPNSWEGAFARLTGADNLEAGAGDLVERLGAGICVAPSLTGDGSHIDIPATEALLAEAAAQLAALTAENARLREALEAIRELNTTGADENGHRWAHSDLIDQEIFAALLEAPK